ncbi:hypothetical protein MHH28_17225 [Paenibacillus sp. FSL K6-1217]
MRKWPMQEQELEKQQLIDSISAKVASTRGIDVVYPLASVHPPET